MSGDIVAAARALLGVRWRHQGRAAETGLDCVGLCLIALKSAGIHIPHIPDYPRRHDGSLLRSALQQHLSQIPIRNFEEGDIGLFAESGVPIHVGVLSRTGGGTVIHAHARRRKVIEEPLAIYGMPVSVFRI